MIDGDGRLLLADAPDEAPGLVAAAGAARLASAGAVRILADTRDQQELRHWGPRIDRLDADPRSTITPSGGMTNGPARSRQGGPSRCRVSRFAVPPTTHRWGTVVPRELVPAEVPGERVTMPDVRQRPARRQLEILRASMATRSLAGAADELGVAESTAG
jgi:hypothetical protein